ncbi:MAG: TAXI family TRAP transporter solute-binding subunit, partial [Acidobacteriota bacterium]
VDGAYFAFAERYRALVATQGFELRVLETAGSLENLELMAAGEADLALIQGGTIGRGVQGLQTLGSIFLEPVWIFHRSDLELAYLSDLRGRRVRVGAEGSGTRTLALDLLADNAIGADDVELIDLGSDEAADALAAGELDAAFFVASASAAYLQKLLATDGVELMTLQRFRAYQVRHDFLSHVVLGEGVVDLDANLPPADVSMVAAAAALVARDDLHHALIPLLIDAMSTVHGAGGLFETENEFPSTRYVDLPMNTEAAHYIENGPSFLHRILPYRTAVSVDRLKILLLPFIPILLIVFKLAPPLYRWRIRSKIYRWYNEVRRLDLLLLQGPTPDELEGAISTLERVEMEVTEVEVPLSYMDEFYNLRVHIELIEKKLRELHQNA